MSVPAPRKNLEASDILFKTDYRRNERTLGYLSDLIQLSEAVGVPTEQREEYVVEMSEKVRPDLLKKATEEYGRLASAVEEAEQNIELEEDERYDHKILNYLTDQLDLGEKPDRPELDFIRLGDNEIAIDGDSEKEWIQYEGPVKNDFAF